MAMPKSASSNIVVRVEMDREKVSFGTIATAIDEAGGDIVAVDVSGTGKNADIRDITVNITETNSKDLVTRILNKLPGVQVLQISDQTFLMHLGGKIEVTPKMTIKTRDDLSRVYTPGVANVCMAIHEDPASAHTLTIKRNTIAVVSDGTAVLGLGDIGPMAAMPVMEGKAMLFKQLAGVDAFPICLDTQDTEEIIATIKRIAPAFGGINLEDISSPRCFEIEQRLIDELDIPVFHDDQHGTAVVLLAGLYNAVKLAGKRLEDCKIVLCGIGAAGIACTKILLSAGATRIVGVDRDGALVRGQAYAHEAWQWYAEHTNPQMETGALSDVIAGADIFIGVSGPGVLKPSDIRKMAKDPIVFAMANPTPEIAPEEAEGLVRVMATGRSDYPNQINNVLCFPGLFRGVLDCRASRVTEEMKLAAAKAIASVVSEAELNEYYIIPSVFNPNVADRVKEAVIQAAYASGVARRRERGM
ncbi:malate dehydrogenase [Paenibacillus darwinianus]|uniref:Malate dehydrogenase n=1 Tax=Paenibacillus darwinianus TaxID=1380763 RepID=A0A9W5S1Y2_9BACL|nr:NAD-dependent malic enzyme [Paenibacillus darwinianus]EXX90380.1 malate dehydrogenase [Paenibacillus darwinianus]EXX91100.1 malate dehydrogenase [Paenibacillus darwinianus]EXX91958.1 malate dehydrogenase [Paenibacillus darwinianus]